MRNLVLVLVALLALFTFIRDFSAQSSDSPIITQAEMRP